MVIEYKSRELGELHPQPEKFPKKFTVTENGHDGYGKPAQCGEPNTEEMNYLLAVLKELVKLYRELGIKPFEAASGRPKVIKSYEVEIIKGIMKYLVEKGESRKLETTSDDELVEPPLSSVDVLEESLSPSNVLDRLQHYLKEGKILPEDVIKRLWPDGRKPTLGQYLRTIRVTKGYSLRDLGKKLSHSRIDNAYLWKVEHDLTTPRRKRLDKIAKALKIESLDYLFSIAYK